MSNCNAAFKSNETLDSHILRNHPDFVESIRGKIHECTQCGYRTVRKNTLTRHMLTHPGMATELIIFTCEYCTATFKSKKSLQSHIVREHRDFSATLSSKIHRCTNCDYKTTRKRCLENHKC
nr:unnamed protein product [Callosobruchus chinensis]